MKFIKSNQPLCTLDSHSNAPMFRRKFVLTDKPNRATLSAACSGFYRIFINGKEITRGRLAPYISNLDHVLYREDYDVTEDLTVGANVVCVLAGNGNGNPIGGYPWGFDKAAWRTVPLISVELDIDGKRRIESDSRFVTAKSPITFDDLRIGEFYDARLESDWLSVDYDDEKWENALPALPLKGEIKPVCFPPVVVSREVKPLSVVKSGDGYLYDFGIVTAGVCRLSISGRRGQKIDMTHGEVVVDGKLDLRNIGFASTRSGYVQRVSYICNGRANSVYTPSFCYFGFRYVFVEGLTEEQATKDLLTMLVMHTDLKSCGSFRCSDERVNKIQACILNSDLSNFFHFPTDCPQREKNAWTGDAALSCEQMILNFDVGENLREWLYNIRKAQRSDGAIPCVVPTAGWGYDWGNGPAWDNALIHIPYMLYKYGGDISVLEENADAILGYIQYMTTRLNADGLACYGLGDWLETGTYKEDDYSTPVEVTDSITCIDMCDKAAEIFSTLGRKADADFCLGVKNEIMDAFKKKYVSGHRVTCDTQTAQAMAIYYGIFKEEDRAATVGYLAELIHRKEDHFSVGILGARVIFHVLADNGFAELAYKMITNKTFPSYTYNIDRGATSVWESFNRLDDSRDGYVRTDGNKMLSLNHHVWGDVSAWFYRIIGGLREINRNKIFIKPEIIPQMDFAEAEYRNGFGSVRVAWKREEEKIQLTLHVTGEMICRVYGQEESYGKGTYNFTVCREVSS